MVRIVERKWLGRWMDSSAVWVPLQKEMSRVWLTRKEGLSWGLCRLVILYHFL